MDNVMKEYVFSDTETKQLCKKKLFKRNYAYKEFSEQLTTFINSILISDEQSTSGIRTLMNKTGGVTLWLSRQTRKKWYIPLEENGVERVLILNVMESVNSSNNQLDESIVLPYKLKVRDPEANLIVTEIDIPYKFSKISRGNTSKYNGYEKIVTTLMRGPML